MSYWRRRSPTRPVSLIASGCTLRCFTILPNSPCWHRCSPQFQTRILSDSATIIAPSFRGFLVQNPVHNFVHSVTKHSTMQKMQPAKVQNRIDVSAKLSLSYDRLSLAFRLRPSDSVKRTHSKCWLPRRTFERSSITNTRANVRSTPLRCASNHPVLVAGRDKSRSPFRQKGPTCRRHLFAPHRQAGR